MPAMAAHVQAMLDAAGARRGDVRLRQQHPRAGRRRPASPTRSTFPGFVPEYIRPLFCEGKGPFRWAALSGDPADIHATDRARARDVRRRRAAVPLDPAGQRARGVPGTAGAHLLARLRRARAVSAWRSTIWCAAARSSAPIVIGRDHLDTGSVASPNRETEGMRDGSDAIADWPILNALLNTSSGATWVSVHHGGGVGIGYSLHAGMVVVADGSREADEKLERVLTCDPGIGVMRHADAGYPEAIDDGASHTASAFPCSRARRERARMMIVERPALERRVLAVPRGAGRIPVILGGCGIGRTSLLLQRRADRSGRIAPVPGLRRGGDDAGALPRSGAASVAASRPPAGTPADPAARRREPRSTRMLAFFDRRRDAGRRARRRSCSTKSSTSARSKASRACVTCCAM